MNTCMKKSMPPNFFIRRPCYGIWQAAGIAFQTETTTLPSPSCLGACLSFRAVATSVPVVYVLLAWQRRILYPLAH